VGVGVIAHSTAGCPDNPFEKQDYMRKGLCMPGRRLWSYGNFHVQYQFLRHLRTHGMLKLTLPRLKQVETHAGRFSHLPYKVPYDPHYH